MSLKHSIRTAWIILLSACTVACAGPKNLARNGSTYLSLKEASVQRILPGRREGTVQTKYRFLLVWRTAEKPESFFFYGPDAWMNCTVYRQAGQDAQPIAPEDVRKGDILELVPVKGGRFPIPAEIPASLKQAIIFKTAKSGWRYLKIGQITKKPDQAMP